MIKLPKYTWETLVFSTSETMMDLMNHSLSSSMITNNNLDHKLNTFLETIKFIQPSAMMSQEAMLSMLLPYLDTLKF